MIRVAALSKHYGTTPALANVSLEVPDGETVVIQGPSGCGKTTLLRLIAGFELPDQGEIYLDGELASRPESGMPPYKRKRKKPSSFLFNILKLCSWLKIC